MAVEEVLTAAAIPKPSDHKRKLDEIAPDPRESVVKLFRSSSLPTLHLSIRSKIKLAEMEPRESDDAKRWCPVFKSSESFDATGKAKGHQENSIDALDLVLMKLTNTHRHFSETEKLINAVIAEADAGDSSSLVVRGAAIAQAVAAPEQSQIQVPNDKLIHQHPRKDDESKERTVLVSAVIKKIDMAKELIGEAIGQMVQYKCKARSQTTRNLLDTDPHDARRSVEIPGDGHRAPTQHPFGGYGASWLYPQTRAQSGYGQQQQFGKPPAYAIPSQGQLPQSYGAPPMTSQPGEAVYQAPAQPYVQNVSTPTQQPCPYVSSAPVHHPHALFESAHATDWYNQPPTASTSSYPQQGGQHATYGQLAPGFTQAAPAGYTQYPTTQQGYPEQPASYTGCYGYEGFQDLAYGGGRPAQPAPGAAAISTVVQPGYIQPAGATTQQSHDQPIPHSGACGKKVSRQLGYTQ